MKTIFLLLTLIIAGGNCFAQKQAIAKADTVIIKFNEENWDFGDISWGHSVTHYFEFINTGTKPLIISSVNSDLTGGWTFEPVLSGEKGYVSANYNAANPGRFTKTLTVHSNCGDKVLFVKGNTVKGLQYKDAVMKFDTPYYGNFGNISPDEDLTKHLALTNIGKTYIVIKNIYAPPGTIVNWSSDTILPGNHGEITVRLKSPSSPGVFYKHIYIVSNSTSDTFRLDLMGQVIDNRKKKPSEK